MRKTMNWLSACLVLILSVSTLSADIHKDKETLKRIEQDEKQRDIFGTYDIQYNTVSNIEFPTTNYGIFGYDVRNRVGGGVWPRGTSNQYIFGGGCWLGARKFPSSERAYNVFEAENPLTGEVDTVFYVPDRDAMGKYCAVTYNPQNARSFMVPGNVRDGLGVDPNQALKYRTYFSTDYDQNGVPFSTTDGPNWPLWDTSDDPEDTLKYNRYFGFYVDDVQDRNRVTFPRGPAVISGEDIFATFKDTDLTAHDLGVGAAALGYPLYLQTEITIYSWGFGRYKDFIFVRYEFVNVSEYRRDGLAPDTLYDCYMAPIMDVDVARKPFSAAGAGNDRVRYYGGAPGEDSTYNLAFQWSDGDRGEQGFGFGYLGFDFLESPSTIVRTEELITERLDNQGNVIGYDTTEVVLQRPENNMVRKDRPFYPNEEQLGLKTFQNWNIDDDRRTDESRYNFLEEGVLETDNGPGDKRFMMVTGPFNMRPGDSVRVVVGICLANTCSGGEATGTTEDICELVALDEFMQSVYDNNFRAPLPPDRSRILTRANAPDSIGELPDDYGSYGLNNAAKISWDETAEMSTDREERGLDFLGYKIFRARRPDLDTFSLSQIEPGDQGFTAGAGLQGWKQIAQYELPEPFVKSRVHTISDGEPGVYSYQDSLRIVGPYIATTRTWDGSADSSYYDLSKLTVMRFPRQSYQVPQGQQIVNGEQYIPEIFAMDSTNNPWFSLFNDMGGPDVFGSSTNQADVISPETPADMQLPIMQEALIGYVDLKPSVVRFNPLYYQLVTERYTREGLDSLLEDGDIVYYTRKVLVDKRIDVAGGGYRYDTIKDYPCDGPNVRGQIVDPITGDTTCYSFVQEIIDQPTSRIKQIVDERSIKPEVVTEYEYEEQIIVNPDGTRDTFQVISDVKVTETGFFTVDVRYPRDPSDYDDLMDYSNLDRINEALDTVYSALSKGSAFGEIQFPDFEGTDIVKERVILPYMASITNNRTFIDIGDDNNNFLIETSEDVRKTEKLINQVPYYYRVLAYDQGHVNTGAPRKDNSGKDVGSPNVVEIVPKAAEVGQMLSFDIIAMDTALVNSLYNFDLFAVDPDRAQQLYAGDTIRVTFTSNPQLNTVEYTNGRQETTERSYGLYTSNITIENVSENKPLYGTPFFYEGELGALNNYNLPTENTFSIVLADTIVENVVGGTDILTDDIGTPRSNAVIVKGGQFSTGNFRDKRSDYTSRWTNEAKGTLSFEFNYYLRQFGGLFRPDSVIDIISEDKIDTKINVWDITRDGTQANPIITNTTQLVGQDESGVFPSNSFTFQQGTNNVVTSITRSPGPEDVYATFNNGPGTYRLILGPEQQETMSFSFGGTTKDFIVPYHDVTMVEETSYTRPSGTFGDSVTIDLGRQMEHMRLPVNTVGPFQEADDDEIGTEYPSPINLYENGIPPKEYIGKFNITTYGFANARVRSLSPLLIGRQFVIPGDVSEQIAVDSSYTGLQGRYVKSATSVDGEDVIDFVNMINIAGANYYTDYANVGRFQPTNQIFRRAINAVVDTIPVDEIDINSPNIVYSNYREENGNYIINGLKVFGNDLGEGDELVFRTKGGVQGIPFDSATVTYVVRGGEPGLATSTVEGYTDEMLDEINVVPNPYYITHQAQRSPYDAKIFFNKLPPVCTIEIYTVDGNLVRTINHDEYAADPSQEALDVWNLLTDSGVRVQSQSLIARIYTPDGASTEKIFSLVVGSFRIVQD